MDKLTLAMAVVAMAALVVCIAINFYEIVNRYVRGKSLYWIQDFTLLMMMWFIFPGITRVSFDNQDIIIDICVRRLPKTIAAVVRTLMNALVCAFSVLVAWEGVRFMQLNWNKNMNISGMPTRYYIVTIIFSFVIVAVLYLLKTIEGVRGIEGGNQS